MAARKKTAAKKATKKKTTKRKATKKATPPKDETLGELADSLWELRHDRLELQRRAEEMKQGEAELSEKILALLKDLGLKKATGTKATVSASVRTVVDVQDWDKVYAYIKKNNRFDLLQKRPSVMAFNEVWDNGKSIPGTEPLPTPILSLRKGSS